jgi:predicted pyridoxine 5'-phosphate oxidase superfamily flavin-nucleotide-binding protein
MTLMGVSGHHEGEQAVQRRAGEGGPEWGSPMFGAEIPQGLAAFAAEQRLAAISAPDDDGAVWTTVLAGPPGFILPVDERTVLLRVLPPVGDPLRDVFDRASDAGGARDIGIVVMSPQTQRRIRVNGRARREGDVLVVHTEQVLGNCPKYLQAREIVEVRPPTATVVHRGTLLSEEHRRWTEEADTFFVGSRASEHGADASHRGGLPGFVRVLGPRRLTWPDYFGNSFYMTLGNMQLDPRCGLVFLDWENGHTLHLTGTGRINWTSEVAEAVPGALRMVEFDVDRWIQVDNASPFRWQLHGFSRFNPPPRA